MVFCHGGGAYAGEVILRVAELVFLHRHPKRVFSRSVPLQVSRFALNQLSESLQRREEMS